jgi:arylsulfatase A-like enzyme
MLRPECYHARRKFFLPDTKSWMNSKPRHRSQWNGRMGPTLASLLLVALFNFQPPFGVVTLAQSAVAGSDVAAPRPRLVLLIVVDQFRYDYLERFNTLYGPNGFRRLEADGASWVDTNYDHIPTYTAPGHATMMTGAWPSETGIIGNTWPERETGLHVSSVTDISTKILGGGAAETGASPRRLLSSTVGDEIRFATNDRSKVIGISMKDRAAILPAGRHANAAYWFSIESGQMASSNYYFSSLPDWVQRFNQERQADRFFHAKWERSRPEADYLKYAGADAPPWEAPIASSPGVTTTFPHVIGAASTKPGPGFYNELESSPFSNDLLLSFAERAIEGEDLGTDADTDVLTVSFSANDYVGHRYGPYSQEVMDISLNVDHDIGALLDFVNKRIGLENTVVAFTADHGVAPSPEQATTAGLPGGRIPIADILTAIRNAISARYNPKKISPDPTTDYIAQYDEAGMKKTAFENGSLYFNTAALARDGINPDEIQRVAGEAAMTVPGINRYFTRAQLASGAISPSDAVARRVLHGFNSKRSGDVVILNEPYKFIGLGGTTTHGSLYSYDTHVPMILMGRGITRGRYYQAATPADIAPTLSALLGIQAPSNSMGRILFESFSTGKMSTAPQAR